MEQANVGMAGNWTFRIRGADSVVKDEWHEHNLIPTEGLNHLLNVATQAAEAKVATWYVGIGTGNYTPLATDTAATIAAAVTESSAYAESTRVALVLPAATAAAVTNSASPAAFTANGGVTVTNAFVSSASVKGATTGILLSSLKLAVAKTLAAGESLEVSFTLSAASV